MLFVRFYYKVLCIVCMHDLSSSFSHLKSTQSSNIAKSLSRYKTKYLKRFNRVKAFLNYYEFAEYVIYVLEKVKLVINVITRCCFVLIYKNIYEKSFNYVLV